MDKTQVVNNLFLLLIKLKEFLNTNKTFSNKQEQTKYNVEGKKFYFMYLMNLGGQSGYKKEIKNVMKKGKSYESLKKELTEKMTENGKDKKFIDGQFSDFHAAIRNERQIFFYFGFFHGKDASDLLGFYNLTAIGKGVIQSNFFELCILWEHQKIKMISQSPINDIRELTKQENVEYKKFAINYHPYLTLLSYLYEKKELDLDFYQYILSHSHNLEELEETKNFGKSEIANFKKKIENFGRSSDTSNEDFQKELKKYILGVCNMDKDFGANSFECLSWIENNKIKVINSQNLNFIYQKYVIITKYLDELYEGKYKNFETALKSKYLTTIENPKNNKKVDDELAFDWYFYNINFDKNVLIGLIFMSLYLQNNKNNSDENTINFKHAFQKFPYLYKILGIKNENECKNILNSVETAFSEDKLFEFETETKSFYTQPKKISEEINKEKLEEISKQNLNINAERKRNTSLIDYLRHYYWKNFVDEKDSLVKCDSCEEKTFLTNYKKAYLEFHHIIPFSIHEGADHYLNLVGICPNCHRKFHLLNKEEKEKLYQNLSKNNNFKITLLERMIKLFNAKALEPIHIDFLKKEKIISQNEYEKFSSGQYFD